MRGLDPTSKAARCANYFVALRHEILALARAMGYAHPAFVTGEDLELLDGGRSAQTLNEAFRYPPGIGRPASEDLAEIRRIMDQGAAAAMGLS
jgi:hypothetical protein